MAEAAVGEAPESPRLTPESRSGRRRRRRTTPAETALMCVAGLLAVAAAVLWSDAAPTGTAAVDAAYRGGVVAILVIAGSRARRWSLTIGTAVTAIAAVGPARLAAVVALAVVLLMVFSDRRDRVIDATVAGVVGVAALHIEAGWFVGLPTVLGFLATFPILVSAYRYSSKLARRRWRRWLAVSSVLAVLLASIAGAAAMVSVNDVEAGKDSTRRGLEAAARGDEAAAADHFGRARSNFRSVEQQMGAWWVQPSRAVPIVGVNVVVVQDSVRQAALLTNAAMTVAQAGDLDSIQRLDGGVDLAALAEFELPVTEASRAARRAVSVFGGMTSPWILPPLAERVDALGDEVSDLRDQLELAEIGIADGPSLLGADSPRRYLILLGNPAELRDMGGHLGNWAELVADGGRLELVDVGGPMELSQPGTGVLEEAGIEVPVGLRALQPERFPQNWGGYPDLDVIGPVAAALFESATGRPVDGVAYADTAAFAAIVGITGEVVVPDLPEPYVLTAANAERFLAFDQFVLFERASVADAAVEQVIEDVFESLTASQLPAPELLAESFHPLVERGSLSLWSRHEGDDRLIDRFGLRRVLPNRAGTDMLAVVQRNAGPNKIDFFLERSTSAEVRWNPATGDVVSSVSVELRNGAPAEGLNRLVVGNGVGAEWGSNVTDLAVLSPLALRSVLVDGRAVPASPQWEDDYWRHTVRVVVPPQGARTVTFRLAGQLVADADYRLDFVGQPTMGGNEVTLRVISSSGAAESGKEEKRVLDGSLSHVVSLTSEL